METRHVSADEALTMMTAKIMERFGTVRAAFRVLDTSLDGKIGQLELRRFIESLGVAIDAGELR